MEQNGQRRPSEDVPKCDIKAISQGRFRHASGECLRHNSGDRHRHASGESGRLRSASGDSSNECGSPQLLESGSKVMIALDDSPHSEETIHYYLRHVHRPENEVILAHVIELPENALEAMRAMLSRETIAQMWDDGVKKAEQIEKQYAAILQEAGVDHIHIRNESGMKPGHALCQVAEKECVNMIVIGSRGEGKIRRTLMGSVSDYIVHHARCPVLVCKYSKKSKSGKGKHSKLEKQ